jgi:hypothetical protein
MVTIATGTVRPSPASKQENAIQSMSFGPVVAAIGSGVITNATTGIQAGATAATSLTGLAPAGADDVSMQAATAFSAEAAQLLAMNAAAQEELARTGTALIQIARMYTDTNAVASDLLGANPLSSYGLAGV